MDQTDLQSLVGQLTLDEKTGLLAGSDGRFSCPMPKIGLRSFQMVDGPSAVNAQRADGEQPALGPCPTGLGASWDPHLVRRVGELQGWEANRRDINLVLGPNINLERSALAGRAFEYFSEDPYLTGALAVAWIDGIQSRGVGAVAKHLVCNDSETKRHSMNSVVEERALREVYLLPFEMVAKAGVWGMMTAYNRTNGVRCSEQPLIGKVVKSEWGFDGMVMSDWHGAHNSAPSAIAGLDFEMPGPAKVYGPHLAEAVRSGHVPEAAIDASVERLLILAQRVGALGDAAPPPAPADPAVGEVLLEAVAASLVLLKNDGGLLPLDLGAVSKLAVIGPNAEEPAYQGGTLGQIVLSEDIVSPLTALRDGLSGRATVVHAPGVLAAPRLPALAKFDFRPSSGAEEKGVTVEYFKGADTSGEPAAREIRQRGSNIWFGVMPGIGALTNDATVRITTVFTPETTGPHLLRTGGAGDVKIWIDDVLAGSKAKHEGQDTMGDLLWPQLLDVEYPMEAGRPVEIRVEMYSNSVRARSLHIACRPPEPAGLMDAAVAAAANADVAIVIVGETTDNAMESVDRSTTRLPGAQNELIDRVCAVNSRTIVVINAGHVVDMPWINKAAAVIAAWFPGQAFGHGLLEVLTGAREPGGRLPLTVAASETDYPAFDLTPVDGDVVYEEATLIGGRSLEARGVAPLFALGHGLGYASFTYADVKVTPRHTEGGAVVSVKVTNTAERRGKDVLQLYVKAVDDPHNPASELKGFTAVTLDPGESRLVEIGLDARALSHWDAANHRWAIRPGSFLLRLGASLNRIHRELPVRVSADGTIEWS